MAAFWISGKYVGCERIQGVKKDGSAYDFYNFCFERVGNDHTIGKSYDVLSGQPTDFPDLLKKENIGKPARYIKQKNYLFICQFD